MPPPLDRRAFLAAAGAPMAAAGALRARRVAPRDRRPHPARRAGLGPRRRPRRARAGPPREGVPRRLLPRHPARRPRADPRDRRRLLAARRGHRRGRALGEPAGPRPGGAPQERRHGDRGARPRRGGGRALLRGHRGFLQPDELVRPAPDNLSERFFDAAVENARKILDAVKPTRTTFCYEMMAWSLPDSPDACLRMLRAVDRKAFAVHLDPCNLVHSPERYYRSSDLLRECYAKLGRHVASVHAKDLTWDVEMAVHFREVPDRPGLDRLHGPSRRARTPRARRAADARAPAERGRVRRRPRPGRCRGQHDRPRLRVRTATPHHGRPAALRARRSGSLQPFASNPATTGRASSVLPSRRRAFAREFWNETALASPAMAGTAASASSSTRAPRPGRLPAPAGGPARRAPTPAAPARGGSRGRARACAGRRPETPRGARPRPAAAPARGGPGRGPRASATGCGCPLRRPARRWPRPARGAGPPPRGRRVRTPRCPGSRG